ncbi:WG containing repeat [Caulobacteraceae bacterium]
MRNRQKNRISTPTLGASLAIAVGMLATFETAKAQSTNTPSLVLYSGLEYKGPKVTIVDDTANLGSVQFDETAMSLVANGPWEVCLGLDYSVRCRTYTGAIPNLESFQNRISSVRYRGSEPRVPKVDPMPVTKPKQDDFSPTTNEDIHELVRAKVPESAIIAVIRSQESSIDKSTTAIIELVKAGASEAVLQAVISANQKQNLGSNSPAQTPEPSPSEAKPEPRRIEQPVGQPTQPVKPVQPVEPVQPDAQPAQAVEQQAQITPAVGQQAQMATASPKLPGAANPAPNNQAPGLPKPPPADGGTAGGAAIGAKEPTSAAETTAFVSAQSTVVEVKTGGHDKMVIFWTADRKVGFGTTRDWHSAPRLDRITISARYDWSNGFSNASAAVRVAGKYGLIDPVGAEIAPVRFDWIERCERGFAVTYVGGKAGLWNCTTRKEQITPRFGALQIPGNDGLVGAADDTGRWGLIRMDGSWSAQPTNILLIHQENGLTSTFGSGVWRMIGPDGTVLEEGVTSLNKAGKNTYIFKDSGSGKFGIKTAANAILAAAEFQSIRCVDDQCIARVTDGFVLLNPETGLRVTSSTFRFITGTAPFVASDTGSSGPFYYVGRNGERLFGREFERASGFNAQGLAVVQSGGKAGVIDRSGKIVLPFQHDIGNSAAIEIRDRHIFARRDGCWGATDLEGREVLPFTFMSHLAYENSNPFGSMPVSNFYSVSGCKPGVGRSGSAVFDQGLNPVLPLGTYDSIRPTENYRSSNNSWVIQVAKGGLEGVYDLTARRELVRPQWKKISADSEYLLVLDEPGGAKGYAYENGRLLSPNGFDFNRYFPEAKAWTIKRDTAEGSLYGIADTNGTVIVQPKFPGSGWRTAISFDPKAGVFTARTEDRTGFLDAAGRTVVPFNYDRDFLDKQWGDFIYGNMTPLPQGGRLVLVDSKGKVLVRSEDFGLRNATYIRPMMFGQKQGFVATFPRSNGKGTHDRLILDGILYEAAGGNIGPEKIEAEFTEGLMPVRINGKFGYLDVMGNMVITPQFDKAGRFIFGLASATADNKIFPINRTGEQVRVATSQLILARSSSQAD